MEKKVRIIHSSIYANNPEKAALDLAALVDGIVKPFPPVKGGWVCFLNDENWSSGEFIEFYPKSVKLKNKSGNPIFQENKQDVSGVGTHFNLSVPKSRDELELICKKRNLENAWRGWGGFRDVWLEDNILIECVSSNSL